MHISEKNRADIFFASFAGSDRDNAAHRERRWTDAIRDWGIETAAEFFSNGLPAPAAERP